MKNFTGLTAMFFMSSLLISILNAATQNADTSASEHKSHNVTRVKHFPLDKMPSFQEIKHTLHVLHEVGLYEVYRTMGVKAANLMNPYPIHYANLIDVLEKKLGQGLSFDQKEDLLRKIIPPVDYEEKIYRALIVNACQKPAQSFKVSEL